MANFWNVNADLAKKFVVRLVRSLFMSWALVSMALSMWINRIARSANRAVSNLVSP